MNKPPKKPWQRWHRRIHYWAAILSALPILIITITGILLLIKKQVEWIQPPTQKSPTSQLSLALPDILTIAQTSPQAQIQDWKDIRRLDVRPKHSIIKIRAQNGWEIQIDSQHGKILQTKYRRTDLIESLHDGTYFHENVKLWVYLPAAILLLILWITGTSIFAIVEINKFRRKKKRAQLTSFP